MSYSINIEYSPAYELIVSFYTYVHHKHLKSIDLPADWVLETRANLPAHFAKELDDERWEVLHRIALLIHQCPDKSSPAAFLHWFAQLPPGEIYERLSPWVHSIPLNLGELRDRSVYLLAEWNEHYLQKMDPAILNQLGEDAAAKQLQSQTIAPVDLVKIATNGYMIDPTENVREVILVPQYHCKPSLVIDFFRGVVSCLYPLSPEPATPSMVSLAQSLSDERRVNILKLLAKGPKTLIEIHQQMKLAKSTVHHHLGILRRSGMICAHFVDSSTVSYYSVRDQIIGKFTQALTNLLEAGDEQQF
ncbi:ArsR/SmtB family transcription factor [Brevibacillus fulvus]|uniref:DNA-binding transcriptional ArsR family regulator n=1 Tax=Brevibacillus fulvus TaxID=1125967 RepID=A0A939BPE7_9BACL|nr:winged helix-turn-helix domain-containing protein [Brevibacillus fulvus]MBM7590385.1 DNA-binding transcriptional ArsR family regulator [Brevibacillus fulvus]